MAAAEGAKAIFKEDHVEADGFRIRYWEAGQGESIVMLGGVTWGLTGLHHALATTNRVVAFELPGLGASPANNRSQSVKELAGTMARATGVVAPDGHTLIGESFGANVALWQALQAPDKVEALVLISPTAILPAGDPMPGAPEEVSQRLFSHSENAKRLPPVDPAILAKERELEQRLQGASHDMEAESRLSDIKCATLVVFGQKDNLVSPEAARVYREKIPNSNVSFVYDAGHLIVAERPEALINAVSDYVERRETFTVSRESSIVSP